MRAVEDYRIEVLITLALVFATYAVSEKLAISGPMAIVAAGLVNGHRKPRYAMSDTTRKYVFALWSLIDELLNSVLFLLIGLEVTRNAFASANLVMADGSIPLTLATRGVSVAIWPALFDWRDRLPTSSIPLLVRMGLRSGILLALALSLPEGSARPAILTATYAVVLFSIAVQGAILGAVARRTLNV